MVNVVAGREIAREFVQDALVPEALAAAVTPLLDHRSAERAVLVRSLAEVRGRLGTPGAAGRVAAIVSALAA